jgi:two-component system, OmpR family, response regulator RpaA
MRETFTTGQVAKMIHVHTRTVAKWMDQGKLRGYRMPGSQARRVPREALLAFLNEYGLAIPPELEAIQADEAST